MVRARQENQVWALLSTGSGMAQVVCPWGQPFSPVFSTCCSVTGAIFPTLPHVFCSLLSPCMLFHCLARLSALPFLGSPEWPFFWAWVHVSSLSECWALPASRHSPFRALHMLISPKHGLSEATEPATGLSEDGMEHQSTVGIQKTGTALRNSYHTASQ